MKRWVRLAFLDGFLELQLEGSTLLEVKWASERTPELEEAPSLWKDVFARYCQTGCFPSNLELRIEGTPFQQKVYHALLKIPPGHTWTYQAVAAFIGHPHAQRAVGQACHRNRLPLVVPCHRVVSRTGLGGYAYGLAMKRRLLEIEKKGRC
jgi:methylated-DNA-[protein]-cysteine S-methyltransferase